MVTLLFFLTESSFLTLPQTGAQKGELSEDRVGRPCGKEATSANSCLKVNTRAEAGDRLSSLPHQQDSLPFFTQYWDPEDRWLVWRPAKGDFRKP